MIYEKKCYLAHPGKAQALRQRFVNTTMPIFKRLGIQTLAVYYPQGSEDELHYIVAFADAHTRQAAWAQFAQDSEWLEAKACSEQEGPLLKAQESELLIGLA